jgi:hypothetical protein
MKNDKTKKIIFSSIFLLALFYANSLFSQGLVTCDGPNCDFAHLINTGQRIIGFIIQIGIAFSAVVFAYAGFLYLTAQGDTGQIKRAHAMFKKVVVGLLVMLGAFLIVELITSSLGLKESIIKLVK